ncbi:GNAT family N-acetyltransferase [Rhodococcus marinonascens]|uniref:GNAT family N-acetyltransferase n=1 Tax=Rhodococcus marinonascens TaxID=38311 RepID=UPI0009331839|nr:GNAT family N-acetyltransferase [Rhodococcus marinonascens]
MIRSAVSTDLPALQDIEIAAGAPFRDIGMDAVADDPPFTLEELTEYLQTECLWVAVDAHDTPVAYALVALVDGGAHIEQVSVHPSHARQRLGALLLDEISAWAAARGLSALTLTTFVGVPWNAPYYERLGFRPLEEGDMTPGLSRIREAEARHRLAAWPRVTMSRPVTTPMGIAAPAPQPG